MHLIHSKDGSHWDSHPQHNDVFQPFVTTTYSTINFCMEMPLVVLVAQDKTPDGIHDSSSTRLSLNGRILGF